MAIQSTEATAVTNDPLAGLPQNPHHMHPQLVFTQGGWFAPDDPKWQEAKPQRMVQITHPLQMASIESSAE